MASSDVVPAVNQVEFNPFPASPCPEIIEENARIFDFALDDEDMARLDALDERDRPCWDPTGVR